MRTNVNIITMQDLLGTPGLLKKLLLPLGDILTRTDRFWSDLLAVSDLVCAYRLLVEPSALREAEMPANMHQWVDQAMVDVGLWPVTTTITFIDADAMAFLEAAAAHIDSRIRFTH